MGEQAKHLEKHSFISELSHHLFWDTDIQKIDADKNKRWLIHRVLEYGLIKDWYLINAFYGLNEITATAIKIRDLDKKTMSFISLLSKIPKEEFKCYSINQSNPKHWNF